LQASILEVDDRFKSFVARPFVNDHEGFAAHRGAGLEVQDLGFGRLAQDDRREAACFRNFAAGFQRLRRHGDLLFAERVERVGDAGVLRGAG
jgi:hypothetical protein